MKPTNRTAASSMGLRIIIRIIVGLMLAVLLWLWAQRPSKLELVEMLEPYVTRRLAGFCSELILTTFTAGVYAVVFSVVFLEIYRRPYKLIVKSLYPTDARPQLFVSTSWVWNILNLPSRVILIILYYANIFSLPSIRRMFYFVMHPFFPKHPKHWLSFLRPSNMYVRAQIFIETKLLMHKTDAEKRNDDAGEEAFEERVREKYKSRARAVFLASWKLPHEPSDIPIECESCFDIFGDSHKQITTYFAAQREVRPRVAPRFLSPINFKTGFLAPTYLVSGLLAQFDEDWTKILNAYRDKMRHLDHGGDPLKNLPDLRKLQSFIWDCWVQWGPSVPICNSTGWTTASGGLQQEVALQFGFGDEDNSLPIGLRSELTSASAPGSDNWVGQTFHDWEKTLGRIRTEAPHAKAVGLPVTVSGHLRWLIRRDRNLRFCTAQHETNAKNQDQDGWMVFEAQSINGNPGGSLFYSAYLWIMIAICKEDRTDGRGYSLLHPAGPDANGERWRGLIPFFEHANIAEESVYESIKRELAIKTVDALLREIEKSQQLAAKWLRFAFVAAFDENGDSAELHAISKTETGESKTVPAFPGKSIRQYMIENLNERKSLEQNSQRKEHYQYIQLTHNSIPEITATSLPTLVQGYLDYVENVTIHD